LWLEESGRKLGTDWRIKEQGQLEALLFRDNEEESKWLEGRKRKN
jgi:hypothetical protein